jgi:hypothetical protein
MGRSLNGVNARFAAPHRALRARRGASVVRAAITLPDNYSTLKAKGENIVVRVAEAEKETKGGVLLPEKAQRKPTSGTAYPPTNPSTPLPKHPFISPTRNAYNHSTGMGI